MSTSKQSKKQITPILRDKMAAQKAAQDRQASIDKQSDSLPYGSVDNGPDLDPYGSQSLQSQVVPIKSKPAVEVKYGKNEKFNSEMGGVAGNTLVLPVIGSLQSTDNEKSIDSKVQLESRKSMPSEIRPNVKSQIARDMSKQSIKKIGVSTERANKIPKKRKDYTDQDTDANSQSVRMKKESIIKKNQQFFNSGKSRQVQLKHKNKKPGNETMDEIQEEFLIDGVRNGKYDSGARNVVTEMSMTKSLRSINSSMKQSPKRMFQSSRKMFENQSDQDFTATRQHNATATIGPGSYELPNIQNGKGFLSNIRNGPAPSFGANMKVAKKSYFHECYKDFLGIDSPGLHKYNPNVNSVKNVQPKFSMARAERFQLPKSIVKIQSQLPTQYATLNFGSNELNHSSSPKVNLMGLGPRHEFGKKELKEGYPGQGAYFLKENPNSISYKIENSPANSFGQRLAFGSTKQQNDKLQYHGQGRHFYGRENQLGPGAYGADYRDYKHQQHGSISGQKIAKNNKIAQDDRGLLPDKAIDERKKQTYNQSHAQIGPASYGGYKETSNDIFKKTSTMRQERSQKIQKATRIIDLTKWRAENMVLIEKGIGL